MRKIFSFCNGVLCFGGWHTMKRKREKTSREQRRWRIVVGSALLMFFLVCVTGLHFFPPGKYDFWPKCLFREATGLLCPGCGTTRALYELTHGNLQRSLQCNLLLPFLPILALGVWRKWKWLEKKSVIAVLVCMALLYAILRNLPMGFTSFLAP